MDSLRAADKESTAPYPQVALRVAEATYSTSSNAALTIEASHFVNVRSDPERRSFTWGTLVDVLSHPQLERASKAECRLLSLVTFGDKRSRGASGSLRNKANVLKAYGLMADYDAGEVSPAEAAARLEAHGIEAFIYTSPSHTAERPRWRAIAPFSGPLAPAEYQALMDRLNGALGGILGAESWDVSRCYYVGKVRGAPYETHHVRGTCINLVDGIEPIGKPRKDREKPAQAESTESAEILHEISAEQLADLRSALSYAPLLRAAGAYELWNEINLALLSLGDVGEELIREYSAAADNYDPEGVEAWIERNRSTVPRSDFRHVFALAAERGWENPIAETRVAAPDDFEALEPGELLVDTSPKPERFRFKRIGEFLSRPRPTYIIHELLPEGDIGVIYGQPSAGKTFVAIDLCFAVAFGRPWRDLKIEKPGGVLYIAAEDDGGVQVRIEAYAQAHGITGDRNTWPIAVLDTAPNFLASDVQRDLLAAIAKAADELGGARLVVVDTLASVTPGADENSAKDMTALVDFCKRVHKATGALVLLIHHEGKTEGRGPRGSSALHGAFCVELLVEQGSNDVRSISVEKLKNGPSGTCFGFRLETVALNPFDGDADGEKPITSCVVTHVEDAPERGARKAPREPRGKNQKLVWHAIRDALPLDGGSLSIEAAITAGAAALTHDPQKGRDRRRETAVEAIDGLKASGWVVVEDDEVRLA